MDETDSVNLVTTANSGHLRIALAEYSGRSLEVEGGIFYPLRDHAYVFLKHEDEGIRLKLAGNLSKYHLRRAKILLSSAFVVGRGNEE